MHRPCSVHCAAMCTADSLCSCPGFPDATVVLRVQVYSAYCPAGVATLGFPRSCRATVARQLVCKQQLICTSTTSQLVSVCTCMCFAFCSSVAYEQDASSAHCCSCCWRHWTSSRGHASIIGLSEAHVVSPIEDVRGEWPAQACLLMFQCCLHFVRVSPASSVDTA